MRNCYNRNPNFGLPYIILTAIFFFLQEDECELNFTKLLILSNTLGRKMLVCAFDTLLRNVGFCSLVNFLSNATIQDRIKILLRKGIRMESSLLLRLATFYHHNRPETNKIVPKDLVVTDLDDRILWTLFSNIPTLATEIYAKGRKDIRIAMAKIVILRELMTEDTVFQTSNEEFRVVWENMPVAIETLAKYCQINVNVARVFEQIMCITSDSLCSTGQSKITVSKDPFFYHTIHYCGWLNFRWVPIFVVFVEGPIHKFLYPRISDFLYEL